MIHHFLVAQNKEIQKEKFHVISNCKFIFTFVLYVYCIPLHMGG